MLFVDLKERSYEAKPVKELLLQEDKKEVHSSISSVGVPAGTLLVYMFRNRYIN